MFQGQMKPINVHQFYFISKYEHGSNLYMSGILESSVTVSIIFEFDITDSAVASDSDKHMPTILIRGL